MPPKSKKVMHREVFRYDDGLIMIISNEHEALPDVPDSVSDTIEHKSTEVLPRTVQEV